MSNEPGARRWVVVATRTIVWETEADSEEEALYHVQEVIMPEDYPEEDPDEYSFSVHEMAGRVVYPHQEEPAFLAKHDESTADLRRLREMLERLGDLSGLPSHPKSKLYSRRSCISGGLSPREA